MNNGKGIITKNRFVSLAAVVVAALIASGCGWWCGWEHQFDKKVDWTVSKLTKELALTKEQTASLEKIKADILEKKKMQKDATMKIDNDIAALIKGPVMEKGRLKELFLKKEEAWKKDREEMRDFIILKVEEFHKMLTPDQRNKLARLYLKHKKQHRHMMHDHLY